MSAILRALAAGALAHVSPTTFTRRGAMIGAATAAAATTATVTSAGAAEIDREVDTTIEVAMKGNGPVKVSRKRFTSAGDPAWTYPVKDVSASILAEPFPAQWPYDDKKDFLRIDEEPDTKFYNFPKLVYHIDEGAVAALTRYYAGNIPANSDILDICSSWVSHYPRGVGAFAGDEDFTKKMKSISATGISEIELKCNDQLTSYKQADLNKSPKLPYPDKSVDVVTCVVSFDYLTQPRQVMREIGRVLRPGGRVILSQSNRCFYTKAVGAWTRDMSDPAHLRVLSTYMHFADGLFATPKVLDISARGPGAQDPMYIVEAVRV